MKTNVFIEVVGSVFDTDIELSVQVSGAPLSISLAPKQPLDFGQIWKEVSDVMQNIAGFGLPDLSGGPWGKMLQVTGQTVQPTLWISPSGGQGGATAAYLELAFGRPISIGGSWDIGGGLTVWLAPNIDIYSVYIGYDSTAGFGLRAKIQIIPGPNDSPPTPAAAKIVTYPFPVPAQSSAGVFKVNYIGLGQRVGPDPVTSDDPMAAIFEQLETQLIGEDPYTILTTLATRFYRPDRNWFIAADLELRGFRIRVLFNDPSMYGLEISVPASPVTPFAGLLFEILYQKLTPNLGVYYGALTLPYALRRIPLSGVILILPGFSIWVYTNGDFRVNIGWPMGNASIGIQVAVLVGTAGLYFAKLRSGDNPGVPTKVDYNPILEFGLGVSLYVHESFNASIFSATLDVTLGGTFQGLLAWETGEGSMSGPPDHYWFAATVSLSVLIQGTIDFSIIKASVLIQFTANAGVAFETGCQTLIAVSAEVRVEVRVKIVFFTIGLSFHTSISKTWQIGSGSQVASLNGPVAMTAPSAAEVRMRTESLLAVRTAIKRFAPPQDARTPHERLAFATRAAAAAPVNIELQFVLQPTAVYANSGNAFNVIASLLLNSPAANGSPASPGAVTPFQQLLTALIQWLLTMFSGGTLEEQLQLVVNALGQGSEAPFGDYDKFGAQLMAFLQSGCTFSVSQVDLVSPAAEQSVAVLPMLPALQMIYVDQNGKTQTIEFDSYNPVPDNYAQAVNFYFQDIGFNGSAPDASARRLSVNASNVSPTNPSMATYVWIDYFAMELRNLAGSLLQLAQKSGAASTAQFLEEMGRADGAGDTWKMVDLVSRQAAFLTSAESLQQLLDQFDWVSAAGLGSRFLLGGLQLPDPSQIPAEPTPENMATVPTAGMYVLTGQQFAIATGNTLASATLQVNPNAPVPDNWITFDSGSPDQATAEYVLPSQVPPEPAPEWIDGSPGQAVSNSIVLTPMPPVSAQPLYVALKQQIAWSDQGQAQTIFPLPAAILNAAAKGVLLTITDTPPPSNNTPASAAGENSKATPALVIPLSLAQVPLHPQGTLAGPAGNTPAGSPAGPVSAQYLPFVYQLNGTNEATRDLIFAALQSDLSQASIRLLYPSSSGSPAAAAGLQSDELAGDVLIAKTNLSTLNQVPMAGAPFVRMAEALGDTDVVYAPVTNVAGFLQLIWEVSVVNAPGFFLFYVTADGKELPVSLFSDLGTEGGMTAQFTLVVEFAQTPQTPVAVNAFTNAVFIGRAVDPATEVLFAGVSTLSSPQLPILQYSSTYAAGNVGYVLTWDRPPDSPEPPQPFVPVAEIYHLLQFQVQPTGGYTASVWSLPAGPAQNNVPSAFLEGSPETAWSYATTIPAYIHKAGSSPNGNIYSAMGDPIEIAIRVIDVYGDALPDTHLSTQTPLYQDPLVPLGAWPGVQFHYMYQAGTNDTASLVLDGYFDPESIAPSDSPASPDAAVSVRQQWSAIAQRYRVIVDQLSDQPNTLLTVSTTLAGGTLPGSASIAASLLEFAQTILAEVSAAASSSPSITPQAQTFAASAPVAFSSVVALTADIVPMGVTVTLARTNTALIDPTALANMPAVASIASPVSAQFASGGSPQSPGAASPLSAFAIEFENAFTNFDGNAGMLKLAQRAGVQSGNDPSQIETLWVVRCSTTAGISVAFNDPLVYFGLKPMSKTLLSVQSGDSATAGADLDLLGQQFVTAFDAFLAPEMATAIAILDVRYSNKYYDQITSAKTNLATTIPLGLDNVFASQIGMGSLSGAQARLTQALLTALTNAFDVTTIVQAPATMQAAGANSPGVTQPPMLFGAVGPITTGSPGAVSPSHAQTPYTLTPGELDIESGTSSPWLTSLLTVAQPGKQEAIYLPLAYDITYLQHDFTDSDPVGAGAYTASSWLKFLRPGDPTLRKSISDRAGIPIPLIFAPTPPSLNSQTASASPLPSPFSPTIHAEMDAALLWEYVLDVTPNWSAQDDLFFEITYNVGLAAAYMQAQASGSPQQGRLALLGALNDFLSWYQANLAQFPTIVKEAFPSSAPLATRQFAAALNPSPNDPAQLVATFATKSTDVATAWAGLYAPAMNFAEFAEEQIIDSFQILRDSQSPQTVLLYGMSDISGASPDSSNPAYWPTVTVYSGNESESWTPDRSQAQQQTGSPDQGWWMLPPHKFSVASFDRLVFTFVGIDLQQRQNAVASAHIRRNAELVEDEPTNPDFVLETEIVTFPTSVIPLIHRATLPTVQPDPAGLQQTLIDIFTPLANPAAQWTSTFRVSAGYSWQLAAPQGGGPALLASDAILLADGLDFRATPINEIAGQLAQEIASWYLNTAPSQQGALLNLAVTVFAVVAGDHLPLIQLDQIPIDVSGVSNTWWSQTVSPTLV